MLRVSPPDESQTLVDQQLRLARWLTEHDFPTSAPLVDEPLVVDGLLVTSWTRLRGQSGPTADRRRFGALVRRFHELTNGYRGSLPDWEPLGRLGPRLDRVASDDVFSDDDRAVLQTWRAQLVERVDGMAWELPPGPIHGDIHTGNLIAAEGDLYLIDLDRIARGPREWDLTQPVAAFERFGGDPAELDDFFAGYGWDLRQWPGRTEMIQLRLLFMTSWLLTVPRGPGVRAEIANRMRYWRDPSDSAPAWNPV